MYKSDFIIAYDISNEKRLRHISKYLEKNSFRIQRSIYLCKSFTKDQLFELLDYLVGMIDEQSDDLRVYKIKNGSIALKSAIDLESPTILGASR